MKQKRDVMGLGASKKQVTEPPTATTEPYSGIQESAVQNDSNSGSLQNDHQGSIKSSQSVRVAVIKVMPKEEEIGDNNGMRAHHHHADESEVKGDMLIEDEHKTDLGVFTAHAPFHLTDNSKKCPSDDEMSASSFDLPIEDVGNVNPANDSGDEEKKDDETEFFVRPLRSVAWDTDVEKASIGSNTGDGTHSTDSSSGQPVCMVKAVDLQNNSLSTRNTSSETYTDVTDTEQKYERPPNVIIKDAW